MKIMQKIFSLFVMITVSTMILSTTAFAAIPVPYSSPTLHSYGAWFKAGNNPKELRLSYEVTANTIADSLGVSSVQICNANGLPIKMVSGTIANGMVEEDSVNHVGLYLTSGESGSTYYAVVTVFATIDGVTDSRTITTSRATAPVSSTT